MSFWASVTHTAASLQKPPNQNFRCIWKSVCPLWRTYKVLHSLRCLYPNLNNNNNKITCLHLCFVGLLCVETEAFPWTCSSSSSCPLLGRSFTDGCNEQRLHSDSRIVHLDTRGKACLGTTALMIDYYNEMKKTKNKIINIYISVTFTSLETKLIIKLSNQVSHFWSTFCLANPGSMTNTTPSIVREVSAMFVDTTTWGKKQSDVKYLKPDRWESVCLFKRGFCTQKQNSSIIVRPQHSIGTFYLPQMAWMCIFLKDIRILLYIILGLIYCALSEISFFSFHL